MANQLVKCLSLWQPWASYIADGGKTTEYRGWGTSYRGPLLIHAAKTTRDCEPEEKKVLPFGAIICKVDLIDCFQVTCKDWHWIVDNVQKLDPIPYKGERGLFDVMVDEHWRVVL
jgi:activating signal cointegrator 1